jgi:hypothetical protein
MTYSEKAALDIAEQLKDSLTQRYWVERPEGASMQRVLRRAAELAGMEYTSIPLSECFPMDLEELLKSLPNKPGVIVLDGYDKTDKYIVDLVNFMLLYYEFRKMVTGDPEGAVDVPLDWKFIVVTEVGAWIPDAKLHKLLCKI